MEVYSRMEKRMRVVNTSPQIALPSCVPADGVQPNVFWSSIDFKQHLAQQQDAALLVQIDGS